MKTTIKITKRTSGYTALVTYPWGEKVRIVGLATRDEAKKRANSEIDRKRIYTLEKDL